MACLDENQVVALVHGTLTGTALREAQEHLDTCIDCLDLVGMFQQSTLDDDALGNETLDVGSESSPDDAEYVPLTASLQMDLSVPPGSQIGRYEVSRSIGRGGMGVVYLARDPQLDRAVALKLVRPSLQEDERADHFERRLMREARAMAKLSHPNVLTIYDVGLHGDQVFLASEWIDGCTLEEWMRQGPHRWRSVARQFVSAAKGLAAAHRAGLVHRDFKPSNVMLGKDDRVYVFDFGLVKAIRPAAADITTQLSGQFVVGTPAYMAPEQMTGESADERSDQFSFCVALYEALAGRRPFSGRNITDLLSNITSGQIAEIKNTPKWLSEMLKRGLSRNPDDRHDSMGTIVDLLDRGIRHSKRRSALAVGAFGVAAGLAASLGYWGGHSGTAASEMVGLSGDVATEKSEAVLEPQFERLDALLQNHKYQDAIESIAIRIPTVSGHRPSEARLWAMSARASEALGHYEVAAEGYEKSFYAAVAGRIDKRAALSASAIYGIYAVRLRNKRGAARWRSLAESAVERSASTVAVGTWLRIQGAAALVASDPTTAYKRYSEAISVLEMPGEEHYALLASAREGLARTLARLGQFEKARVSAVEALDTWTHHLGRTDPNTAMAQVRLADILLQQGDVDAARGLCTEASETLIAVYGELHPRVARVFNSMAEISVAASDFEAANTQLLRSLKIKRELYGTSTPQLVSTLINLMDVARMRARFGDVVVHGREAEALLDDSDKNAATATRLQRIRLAIAEALLAVGKTDEALTFCRTLHGQFGARDDLDAASRGRALACMGRALLGQGKTAEGLVELKRSLKVLEGEETPYLAQVLFSLAKKNADREAAKAQAKQAFDAFEKAGSRWQRERDAVRQWLETPGR